MVIEVLKGPQNQFFMELSMDKNDTIGKLLARIKEWCPKSIQIYKCIMDKNGKILKGNCLGQKEKISKTNGRVII
jgi:hypothetical protein